MTTETAARLRDELMVQERAYLEAVQSNDGDAAARLTASSSLVVSGNGAMKIDGAAIKKMVAEHDSKRRYEIDDASVQVVGVTGDVAIVSYRLRTIEGCKTSDAYDTDVWVRENGSWLCALHAEVPAAK